MLEDLNLVPRVLAPYCACLEKRAILERSVSFRFWLVSNNWKTTGTELKVQHYAELWACAVQPKVLYFLSLEADLSRVVRFAKRRLRTRLERTRKFVFLSVRVLVLNSLSVKTKSTGVLFSKVHAPVFPFQAGFCFSPLIGQIYGQFVFFFLTNSLLLTRYLTMQTSQSSVVSLSMT